MSNVIPLFRASATARTLLAECDHELGRAAVAVDPADRYIAAHFAAVHAAVAFVKLVHGPGALGRARGSRSPAHGIWEQLVGIDPEWTPWAIYFHHASRLRRGLELGLPVDARLSDEMTAAAEDFRDEIAAAIEPGGRWDAPADAASRVDRRGARSPGRVQRQPQLAPVAAESLRIAA